MKVRAHVRASLDDDAQVRVLRLEASDYHEAYALALDATPEGWHLDRVEVEDF